MDKDITNLLDAENDHIKKLQEIVRKTIEDENLIIQNLLNPPKEIKGKKYLIRLRNLVEVGHLLFHFLSF